MNDELQPRPAGLEDAIAALAYLISERPERSLEIRPCEKMAGKEFGLRIEFVRHAPGDTSLIISLEDEDGALLEEKS